MKPSDKGAENTGDKLLLSREGRLDWIIETLQFRLGVGLTAHISPSKLPTITSCCSTVTSIALRSAWLKRGPELELPVEEEYDLT